MQAAPKQPTKTRIPTEEEKKRAFEMKAELKIYQLYQLAEVLDLSFKRGAFHGREASHVGALFDQLTKGVDQAFKYAKESLEAEASKKLEPIAEEPVAPPAVPAPVVEEPVAEEAVVEESADAEK